jgi:hypothetical protein
MKTPLEQIISRLRGVSPRPLSPTEADALEALSAIREGLASINDFSEDVRGGAKLVRNGRFEIGPAGLGLRAT